MKRIHTYKGQCLVADLPIDRLVLTCRPHCLPHPRHPFRLRDKLAAIRAHLARCQAAAKDNAPVEGAPELTATAIHERAVAECPK